MTTGIVELDGGKLYYEDSGNYGARDVVVLNHAGFLDSRMWDDQWEAFSQHYRVIRYDMLGYGQSDPVTGPRVRRHDLLAFLQQLHIDRAHLVGCSMGGEIVLDLALEHPDLVASLVLVNSVPSGFELQGEPPPYLFEMMGAMAEGDADRASELQLRIWFDGPHRRPEDVDGEIRRRAAEMNRAFVASGTWQKTGAEPTNPLDPPAVMRLGEVRAPTVIVTGALDHGANLRAADMMAAGIPNAERISIPDTAHVPNLESPRLFNQTVLGFLSGIKVEHSRQ